MGAEESVLRIGLIDFPIGSVFGPGVHALGGVEDVEGDEEGECPGQDEKGGAHLVATQVPVGAADRPEEQESECERPALNLHEWPPSDWLALVLIWGCDRALGGASSGW